MRKIHIISTFTDKKTQGRQIGLFYNQEEIPLAQCEDIARSCIVAELVCATPTDNGWKLSFFRHGIPIPFSFAGALAAVYLSDSDIYHHNGTPIVTYRDPYDVYYIQSPDLDNYFTQSSCILPSLLPNITVHTPVSDPGWVYFKDDSRLVIQVNNYASLCSAKIDEGYAMDITRHKKCNGIYLFSKSNHPDYSFVARSFSTRKSVLEEEVDGMGAALFMNYILSPHYTPKKRYAPCIIGQGWSLRKPGTVYSYQDKDGKLFIGGHTRRYKELLMMR